MKNIDFVIISQSNISDFSEYSNLPLERIELYKPLVYPRAVYYRGGFHSHIDLCNFFRNGNFFSENSYIDRQNALNIWNLPSMSGIHIANYLLKYDINTGIINNLDSEWDIFCDIYKNCENPPLVGISSTFYLSYREIKKMIQKLRIFDPDMEIVVGGSFINEQFLNSDVRDFEEPMRKYKINYVLYAFNSENDLQKLIFARKSNADLKDIPNLATILGGDFEKGDFIFSYFNWNEPILGNIPYLWDKLELPFVNHTVQIRTSSGCPFSCAFCSYPQTARKYAFMDESDIEKHIKAILSIRNINKIIFIDDTFNVPTGRFKRMCRLFAKYDFEWFSFLRAQFIDEETASLMKDSGCKGVYIGVESADDNILANMNKKVTSKALAKGIDLLNKNEISTICAFIIGFPGETEKTIDKNIKFIDSVGMDYYTLKEFYYMKHTPVYKEKDKFELSGTSSNWKHMTMNYSEAQMYKIKIFMTVKNSVFIDPDTSLWHLAYLYDAGYSLGDIMRIQKEINLLMHDQIEGRMDDNHDSFAKLKDFCMCKLTQSKNEE